MTKEELKTELKNKGYKEDGYENVYKHINKMKNCLCNEKPPVIQIAPWDLYLKKDSASISVKGQTKDGYWVNIDFYTLSFDEIVKDIQILEDLLTDAWNSIN